MKRRCWVEIDLKQLKQNYITYTGACSQRVLAVVKADAYGHGAIRCARALQEAGCNEWAVSCLSEALELRNAGIKGFLLILGYTPAKFADVLIENDITQALVDEEHAESFLGTGVKVQFAINTGMNRIGLNSDNPDETASIIRKYAGKLNLNGIFTHLCVADTPSEDEFTKNQLSRFKAVAERISDLNLPYIHCMNTAGGLSREPYGSFVRLGISLYGLRPDTCFKIPDGIKPVIKWKVFVATVFKVKTGETIGYGRTFKADRDMDVATITVGYADGLSRSLSNKGYAFLNNKKCPIVGRVCMDQTMIDVTGLKIRQGDEIELLNEYYTAEEMARDCNTISYEIVSGITKRVEREYVS
ncbi:MAG: alanine racemase [Eubacteriales bacterium]|nr:alanine racemase [Eubacteriales bacterium]